GRRGAGRKGGTRAGARDPTDRRGRVRRPGPTGGREGVGRDTGSAKGAAGRVPRRPGMPCEDGPMENYEIADVLNEVADLLEIQGENPFRVRAYRNAARTIDEMTQPLEDLVQDRKSTRLNSSHVKISYAVFCLKRKKHM